jgi:hypothetical protein
MKTNAQLNEGFLEFFDNGSLKHHEFVSSEETVTSHFYAQILQRLRMDSGFCIRMTHRDSHRLLSSSFSPIKTFLSSFEHRTVRISIRVTFGCSLL